jgi:hypothetical protein
MSPVLRDEVRYTTSPSNVLKSAWHPQAAHYAHSADASFKTGQIRKRFISRSTLVPRLLTGSRKD